MKTNREETPEMVSLNRELFSPENGSLPAEELERLLGLVTVRYPCEGYVDRDVAGGKARG